MLLIVRTRGSADKRSQRRRSEATGLRLFYPPSFFPTNRRKMPNAPPTNPHSPDLTFSIAISTLMLEISISFSASSLRSTPSTSRPILIRAASTRSLNSAPRNSSTIVQAPYVCGGLSSNGCGPGFPGSVGLLGGVGLVGVGDVESNRSGMFIPPQSVAQRVWCYFGTIVKVVALVLQIGQDHTCFDLVCGLVVRAEPDHERSTHMSVGVLHIHLEYEVIGASEYAHVSQLHELLPMKLPVQLPHIHAERQACNHKQHYWPMITDGRMDTGRAPVPLLVGCFGNQP